MNGVRTHNFSGKNSWNSGYNIFSTATFLFKLNFFLGNAHTKYVLKDHTFISFQDFTTCSSIYNLKISIHELIFFYKCKKGFMERHKF
jgi:hypothetical protein